MPEVPPPPLLLLQLTKNAHDSAQNDGARTESREMAPPAAWRDPRLLFHPDLRPPLHVCAYVAGQHKAGVRDLHHRLGGHIGGK